MSTGARIALVAVAYVVAGKLALLLAIPPGYATAVWPAAGVALVALITWGRGVAVGILIGSFLVNVRTGFDSSSAATVIRSLLLALVIGAGATLQAAAGVVLIRRRVKLPTRLEEQRDIVLMVVLGGPVACVVAATVGVATLVLVGNLPLREVPFSWLTWWVGDTVGCTLMAPPLLLATVRPRPSPRRLGLVAMPLLLGFAVVTSLYVVISHWERRRQYDAFGNRAAPLAGTLQARLGAEEDMVVAAAGLFAASEHVTTEQFRQFAAPLLARDPALLAIGWDAGDLDGDDDSDDRWATVDPAAARFEHDPGSEPVRRATLAQAARSRAVTASGAVALKQAPARGPGLLIAVPQFRGDQLAGFAVGVVGIADVVAGAGHRLDTGDVQLTVTDASAAPPSRLFGTPGSGAAWFQADLDVGGRRWQLALWPTAASSETSRSWVAWTVLAGGLVFVGLLGVLTLTTTGRAIQAERETARVAQAERAQRMLFELSELANRRGDLDELRHAVTRLLGDHLGVAHGGFDEVDPLSRHSAVVRAAMAAGTTVAIEDVREDPRTRESSSAGLQPPLLSSLAVPLFRDGVWRRSLWIGHATPHPWSADEIALVQRVAEKGWLWMEQLRLGNELRDLNQNLERLVVERTRHLDAAIREREVLLKEIHHRVKNNLQVITSLLGLQAHHVTDVEIRAVLDESRTRVLAIALVHENLYQTDDLSEVGLDTYLRSLLANLAATYDAGGRGIEIAISAAGVHLPVNVAIPCGLAITELVTNAFKHAFPAGRRGRIAIEVTRAAGLLVLTVGDDGVGLPPAFEVRPSSSLGMDLVHTFAEQLGASLEIGSGPGAVFTLRFDPGAPEPALRDQGVATR